MRNPATDERLRVLLVDAGGGRLTGRRLLLENDGYEVVQAADVEAALVVLGQSAPDLVFLSLPDEPSRVPAGFPALAGHRAVRRVPLMVVTGSGSEHLARIGIRLRDIDFILRQSRRIEASRSAA